MRWRIMSGLLFFPATAVLHHLVFYRPTCLLNPFGPEYDVATLSMWVTRDPSPGWAAALCLAVYLVGLSRPGVRRYAVLALVALLPLTLWIWDAPLTGRWICAHFHDGRTWLHTRHLYVLAALVFGVFSLGTRPMAPKSSIASDA